MLLLRFFLVTLGLLVLWASPASAELLALLNYESKPGQPVRREGIAIMEIDPESADFGKILMDIPLPSDLVAHHIFFNRDKSKAYITSLGKSLLLAIDLTRFPYRLRTIDVPDCQVNEDLVVSEDNKTWFLTCMGSSNVVMGDAQTDRPIKTISSSDAAAFILYPHGIAIHNGIDRVLVTSTVKPDMSDQGDTVTVLEAKTGKVLSTHQVASKPTPAKSAPVEVMFSPNSTPPWCTLPTCSRTPSGPGFGIRSRRRSRSLRSTTSVQRNRGCRWRCSTTRRETASSSPRPKRDS